MKKINEILRQYYLNLFSSSAEITKNGNNNYIYKWNIRDLKLNNAEIALIQIANNRAKLTDERQYPPKTYDSFTEETTETGGILNINPTTYIKETITLNTSEITYGSGEYIIYSSRAINDVQRLRSRLFNYNVNEFGAYWGYNNYDSLTGYFVFDRYIKNDFLGEWSIIKFPTPLILTKYIIHPTNTSITRAPSLFKFYGSNDGVIWEEIQEASTTIALTTSDYINNIYQKVLNSFKKPYFYIGFTINKIIGLEGSTGLLPLGIAELQLFGREEIKTFSPERVYPPKLYNSFTPEATETGEILNINPAIYYKEVISLNYKNITYGIGDYVVYSSSSFLDVARTRARLFNKTYISTIDDIGANWVYNGYNIVDGSFLLSSYIKNDYLGDWCIIKFPKPITLKRYIFFGRDILLERAPALWRFYGSNDGINFQIIQEASNDGIALTALNYPMNSYEGFCNNNETSYLFIGFTVNKIVGNSTKTGFTSLLINELELYGKEELTNNFIIRSLNTYNDGYCSQSKEAVLYMGNDLKIKNPTYHKLISKNINNISLSMSDDFNVPNNGIRSDIDLGLILHIKDYKNQQDNNL